MSFDNCFTEDEKEAGIPGLYYQSEGRSKKDEDDLDVSITNSNAKYIYIKYYKYNC
jgi:hypothetical protein